MNPFTNFQNFANSDPEMDALLERYENMVDSGKLTYLDEEEYLSIFKHFFTSGDADSALRCTDFAIEQYPREEDFLVLRIVALLENKDFDEAMSTMRRIEKFPSTRERIEMKHLKAVVLLASGKIKQGMSLLDRILASTSDRHQQKVFLSPAIEFLQRRNAYPEALKYILQLSYLAPTDTNVLLLKARGYRNCGMLEDSIDAYELFLKTTYREDVLLELGKTYERNEQNDKALKIYNKVIKENPENILAYWQKAAYFAAKGKLRQVGKVHDALLAKHPKFAPAWYTRGRVCADMENYEDAMMCYHKALELEPYYSDAYYAMAMVMIFTKRPELQMEYAQRAIAMNPYNQGYYLCYASAQLNTASAEDVEKTLRHCLAISGDFSPAWLLLADLHATDSYQKAIATLKEAQDYLPEDMRIVSKLAAMYYKNHNLPQCWQQIETLLRYHPIETIEFLKECPEASIHPGFVQLLKGVM
jgi:tetratricopeptide (TPR) repeat protein